MGDVALRAEWVTDEADFQRLVEPWNGLADRVERQSVFLRHEWFTAAWQWRKRDSTLRLLCMYRDTALVGIVPLVQRRYRQFGIVLRALEFLTVPDTQYCDVLVENTDREAVLGTIAKVLIDAAFSWDVLQLSYLDESSVAADDLKIALAAVGVRAGLTAGHVNPFVVLEGGWKAFYGGRSRRLKKANNYIANQIERAGGKVDVTWIYQSSAATAVDRGLAATVEISGRSWKRKTGKSLDQPGPNAFIHSITGHAHRNGWLSIWLLLLNSKPVAMEYQLIYRGHVHALRADYDQAFHDLSPGSYLSWKLLERLFDANCSRYWMGPGENAYKFRWTDATETLFEMTAYSRTLRGRLLGVLKLHVLPRLRRWVKRAPPPQETAQPE